MNTPRRLIVQWQDHDSRRWFPVAELLAFGDGDAFRFELGYIAAVLEARKLGFQPFAAFPEIDRRYGSNTLFPFFQNRVLPTTRPDYLEYVTALGLTPDTADVVDLLGRSEGRRHTDRIETVLAPERDPRSGRLVTHFLIRGVRHVEGAEAAAAALQAGDPLAAKLEPTNQTNPRARILDHQGRRVGYVPDYLVTDLDALENAGSRAEYTVVRSNPAPAPAHHRVLVRMEAGWPTGFRPFAGPAFAAVVPATRGESVAAMG
jgi:hypothetical protein